VGGGAEVETSGEEEGKESLGERLDSGDVLEDLLPGEGGGGRVLAGLGGVGGDALLTGGVEGCSWGTIEWSRSRRRGRSCWCGSGSRRCGRRRVRCRSAFLQC
jgi:hypothetical protein